VSDVRAALRWGTWTIAGITLLLLYRAAALVAAGRYGHPDLQRAAYLTSVGAWIVAAGLLAWSPRRGAAERIGRAVRALLLLAVLGATAVATLALPAGQQPTGTSWAVATNGWLLLAVAAGRRTSSLLVLLALPLLLALVVTALAGVPPTVLMAARALGVLGLQAPVALAAHALDRSARAAAALRLEREEILTGQHVAATVHAERLERSQAVATAVGPVLADLAALGPAEAPGDHLRRRCGVAGARVRRLLSEWHRGGPDPLGGDLAGCLDQLQATGLRVELAVRGRPDQVSPALAGAACDVVLRLAPLAVERMRVTLVATATLTRLAVVIDRRAPILGVGAGDGDGDTAGTGARPGPAPALPDVPEPLTLQVTTTDDTLWVELTCPL